MPSRSVIYAAIVAINLLFIFVVAADILYVHDLRINHIKVLLLFNIGFNLLLATLSFVAARNRQKEQTLSLSQYESMIGKISVEEKSIDDPEMEALIRIQPASRKHLIIALFHALRAKDTYEISQIDWRTAAQEIEDDEKLRQVVGALSAISTQVERAIESTADLVKMDTMWKVNERIVLLTRALTHNREVGGPLGLIFTRVITHWGDLLVQAGEQIRAARASGPVANPYVIGNPVLGALFVGREGTMRRLEELWGPAAQCPSVVLYGHRRMGKTSILQNLKDLKIPGRPIIVDFNMQAIGWVQSTGEFLYGLALRLYDAAAAKGLQPLDEPEESGFMNGRHYLAFSRYLHTIDGVRDGHRFFIAVDEFESIEQQIDEGRISADLLGACRAAFQRHPWFVMVFAGLHRLEELRADYWNPLFGSVTAIEVDFLSPLAARKLITSPSPDFQIDYDKEAIDSIIALTHGQPYLIQLICHSLVSRYNQQVVETEALVPPPRRFSRADVDAVVGAPALFLDGTAYFRGVWSQAGQGPPGQTAVLRALAPAAAGLPLSVLGTATGLDEEVLGAALRTLERHAVVTPFSDEDGLPGGTSARYAITVELMRRWVAAQAG